MKRLTAIGAVLAAVVLAACGSSSGGGSSSTASGVLTIDNESGSLWTWNFNPFNLSDISYGLGPVDEPVMFVNALQGAQGAAWRASGVDGSDGNKMLALS